jgi:hypothetical protein
MKKNSSMKMMSGSEAVDIAGDAFLPFLENLLIVRFFKIRYQNP